ncbi:hypothetical protein [Mycolicibacterium brisbanense]|nr:hypothetical protein [Mycolicibacterium brisbanense]
MAAPATAEASGSFLVSPHLPARLRASRATPVVGPVQLLRHVGAG